MLATDSLSPGLQKKAQRAVELISSYIQQYAQSIMDHVLSLLEIDLTESLSVLMEARTAQFSSIYIFGH